MKPVNRGAESCCVSILPQLRNILSDALSSRVYYQSKLNEYKVNGFWRKVETNKSEISSFIERLQSFKTAVTNIPLTKSEKSVENLVRDINASQSKLVLLQQIKSYLNCLKFFTDKSARFLEELPQKNLEPALTTYSLINVECWEICDSACDNIVKYASDITLSAYSLLQNRLFKDFQKLLHKIGYPFAIECELNHICNEILSDEAFIRDFVVYIELARQLKEPFITQSPLTCRFGWKTISNVTEMFLYPFSQRFLYHFYGVRETNRLDKPEWYFVQIIKWYRFTAPFLNDFVQNFVIDIDINTEFLMGLMRIVVSKLKSVIPDVIEQQDLFAHLIDECFSFAFQFIEFGYPPDYPSCMSEICQHDVFTRFLEIQENYGLRNIDAIFSSVFRNYDSNGCDADAAVENSKSESIDYSTKLFIAMLKSMCDKTTLLVYPSCQLRFMNIQKTFLDRCIYWFSKMQKIASTHSRQMFYEMSNSVYHLSKFFEETKDLPNFIYLQQLSSAFEHFIEQLSEKQSKVVSPDVYQAFDMSKYVLFKEDNLTYEISGSIYDDALDKLKGMQIQTVNSVVRDITGEIKNKLDRYFSYNWKLPIKPKDVKSIQFPQAGVEGLSALQESVKQMTNVLVKDNLPTFFKNLMVALDNLLYKNLVLKNRFSLYGGMQLDNDIRKHWLPVFLHYDENFGIYFRRMKEACILLNLLEGTAMLLKELLSNSADPSYNVEALKEYNIYVLSVDECRIILDLRELTF